MMTLEQSHKPKTMDFPTGFAFFLIHLFLLPSILSAATSGKFIKCLSHHSTTSTPVTNILFSPNNTSYTSIFESSVQNLKFIATTTPKPQFIITPLHESHIQAAVICSKKLGFLVRVRSGGHDYEGLSYISYSHKPFIIIDLGNFENITVDIKDSTAWVQAGATVGQVYYRIAEQSSTHGFPAGVCQTIGMGGHIAGGGLGFLWRKYGLSADNILDAYFIDVKGKLHDRKSMGEDLFWALRGGGGASFGVIVAWKIQLVPVPSVVTVFNTVKTLEQGATSLYHKWQTSAPKFDRNLQIRTFASVAGVENRTVAVQFQSIFLGTVKELLPLMRTSFPELGVEAKDCTEMSWINSTLVFASLGGQPLDVLLNRTQSSINYYKGKSDFVKEAISITDLESIWKVMLEEEISPPLMISEPMGGRMDEISEGAIPFPHRSGNLYNIQYYGYKRRQEGSTSTRYVEATRRLYNYMTPYVSNSPRASYFNYKDLDLGVNRDINTSYLEASVWGEMYFKSNFARLACVKSKVDPGNFFWNEQSIPPFFPNRRRG